MAPRVSFQRPRNVEERTYESKRLTHDLALGPDVTFEDRFMNIGTKLSSLKTMMIIISQTWKSMDETDTCQVPLLATTLRNWN